MRLIPDDPIIHSMERTGYPPWMQGYDEYDEEEDDGEREEDY